MKMIIPTGMNQGVLQGVGIHAQENRHVLQTFFFGDFVGNFASSGNTFSDAM